MIAIVVAGLGVGVAISPILQKWYFERALARLPGVHVTVDSVFAGWSGIQITNLRLERDGATLELPSVTARLPMKTALWEHRFAIERLVAKDWTLDLSKLRARPAAASVGTAGAEPSGDASTVGAPEAPAAAQPGGAFRGLLSGLELPAACTITAVTLEGTVLCPEGTSASQPARVTLSLQGGELGAGHRSDFAVHVASADAERRPGRFTADGHLRAAIGAGGAVEGVTFEGNLASDGLDQGAVIRANVARAAAGRETYALELEAGSRSVASVTAGFEPRKNEFRGQWSVRAAASELSRVVPAELLEVTSATATGEFATDPEFRAVHLDGRIDVAAPHVGVLALPPAGPPPIRITGEFAATHGSGALRVERLSLSFAKSPGDPAATSPGGAAGGEPPMPVATLRSLQAFTVDEQTGTFTASVPQQDLLAAAIRRFPLSWLPLANPVRALVAGEITGDLTLRAAGGKLAVRSVEPLTVADVAVRNRGQVVVGGLRATVTTVIDDDPVRGWAVKLAPLAIAGADGQLGTIDATIALRPDGYGRLPIHGHWTADLDTLKREPTLVQREWIRGKTASGEFTLNVGAAADLTAKLQVLGHAADHSLTATINGSLDDFRRAAFQAPLKIAFGPKVTDLSVEGSWARKDEAQQVDIQVSGGNASLDQLKLLTQAALGAGEVATADRVGAKPAVGVSSEALRSRRPWWGNLIGRVRVDLRQLETSSRKFYDVGATFGIDRHAVELNGGRAVIAPDRPAKPKAGQVDDASIEPPTSVTAEGTLAFDPTTAEPYRLTAKVGMDNVDAVKLLGGDPDERDPLLEGRFTVSDTITAGGRSSSELAAGYREQIRLTSDVGIIRLLKTNVAAALPDAAESTMSNTLANVGYAVSALFGRKGPSGNVKVSKQTEGVLDFTYQAAEIGYTHFSLTALRRADGSLGLEDISIQSPRERLAGRGEIGYAPGKALRDRPLSLELQLRVSGIEAERLETAGLLSADHDADGFTRVREPIRFGGTLANVDKTQWRDLLAKAAVPPK